MSELNGSGGIGFSGVLFLVFLILKLTGTIDWSWWWVTLPLWGPLAVLLALVVGAFTVALVVGLRKNKYDR